MRSVDVTDPLAAYVALRDLVGADQVFLLESLAGPVADTRASLAGVTGLLEVQVHRSWVTFTGVADLVETAGVFGARITGGGWGGCAIALTRPGVLDGRDGAWVVRPSDGASRT